jgi:glucosamine--fructose-6-phosphate aminotransferase (isomerizing)
MCGIFGYFDLENSKVFYDIGKHSETRGKEASGLVNISQNTQKILKFPVPFSNKKVKKSIKEFNNSTNFSTYIGHTRLKTHGDQNLDQNNQPVVSEKIALVHNGILVNYKELISDFNLQTSSQLDSEIIPVLINRNIEKLGLLDSLKFAINEFSGEVSIAGSYKNGERYFLYTNTGSIYYLKNKSKVIFFSSEEWITESISKKYNIEGEVFQLHSNSGIILDSDHQIIESFSQKCNGVERNAPLFDDVIKNYKKENPKMPNFKRCKKCILPETVPFLNFNDIGICNYCIEHKPHHYGNIQDMLDILEKEENIVVGFSGGRDSSYGLSILKSLLNKNFIAVSFDWGMVTDLARRNQARVVGKLGVEHVWVSADIIKKRKNIKKNFIAWLSKPEMGMIPILMAGDKEWQKQLLHAAKNKSTDYVVQFQSPYEHTYFKYGYAGVKPHFSEKNRIEKSSTNFIYTFRIAFYYLKNFILNPRYFNSSLLDTMKGFFSFYFKTGSILSLFENFEYVEDKVNNYLQQNFLWECDLSTPTTWRIGDGTAPVYNYIYWIYGGFTENDFYRSNQIREGKLTRDSALLKIKYENQPRYDLMKEYCKLIDLDYEFMINKLENFKKKSLIQDWYYENE